MAKKPTKSDDWKKFERAVDTLLRSPPKHKEKGGQKDSDRPKKAKQRPGQTDQKV